MYRWKALLPGAFLLFWVKCVTTDSVWNEPYFLSPVKKYDNVTWQDSSATSCIVSILEGTEGIAELLRMSYQPEGDDKPGVSYIGARGLEVEVAWDEELTPFFLQATQPGDYETGDNYLTLLVTAPIGLTTKSGSVTVLIENVNDNPPIIVSPSSCKIEENYEGPTLCTFLVTDADGGACFAEMLVDDDHFSFILESAQTVGCKNATFTLKVDKALDFEQDRLHCFTITAKDYGQMSENQNIYGYQEQSVSFAVNVIDLPDEPPRWETIIPFVTVNEKESWSTQLRAVDGDYGLNWPIVYTLQFPDDDFEYALHFSIDTDTGLLTGKEIDRDALQREAYIFRVVATEVPDREFDAMSVSNNIVVMINDINDNIPTINPRSVSYLKFAEEQPFTAKDFKVYDPDLAENGTFHLMLEHNFWSSNFLLVPGSGYQSADLTILSLDPSMMDYEDPAWRFITLTIIATEEANPTHSTVAELYIELLDLFDEAPVFDANVYDVEFPENRPLGYLVVQTPAHDPDENDVITFHLRNSHMTIDNQGQINTITENAFDYERQNEIILQVVVEDMIGLKDFCQVNIRLTDLNDEKPSIYVPYEMYPVAEHSPEGERASYNITATDPDSNPSLTFIIDWDGSAAYKQGLEVRNKDIFVHSVKLADAERTGDEWFTYLVIANSNEFDWEEFDTLTLQISVIDENTDPDYLHNERDTARMIVILDDINDSAPVFTEDLTTHSVTVMENTPGDRVVGYIYATDDDSPPYSTITYSIAPLWPNELVEDSANPRLQINAETGVLRTTDIPIDCDEWQTLLFMFTVTATDGLFYTSMTFSLNIEDINDEIPEVIEPENLWINNNEYEEHQEGRLEIGCIVGKDIDFSENYHTITYYLEEYMDLFEMDGPHCRSLEVCCLFAINGLMLDREVQETYVIHVYSRDNFKEGDVCGSNIGSTTIFNVTLRDINDNPPVFVNDGASTQFFETKLPDDLKLMDVIVSDADIGDNGRVYCKEDPKVTSVPDRNSTGVFRVDPETCNIHATHSLIGLWGIYTFVLTAYDMGTPSLMNTGTYTVNVINENLNDPVITYPERGENILLKREQVIGGIPLKDVYENNIPDFEAHDDDDPMTGNGQVTFTLTGGENIFALYETALNIRTLQMISIPPIGRREFTMTLQAEDKGEQPRSSEAVEFNVYVLNLDSAPEFTISVVNVRFSENSTGMEEMFQLPEAINLDYAMLDPNNRIPIYYYIVGGDTDLFVLNETTRILRVKNCCLDYKIATEHTLKVLATHEENHVISGKYPENSVLGVIVQVIDINDLPPEFSQKLFPGTFTSEGIIGQKVAELKAEDPDTGDSVTYAIVPGTMKASHPSLEMFAADNSFIVDPKTGEITLNFSPGDRDLDGYLEFEVKAYDAMGDVDGHRDFATVNIFVVSAHQVAFHF